MCHILFKKKLVRGLGNTVDVPAVDVTCRLSMKLAGCRCSVPLSMCALLPRTFFAPQVVKRLPNLKKLDGIPIDVDEKEAAAAARGG